MEPMTTIQVLRDATVAGKLTAIAITDLDFSEDLSPDAYPSVIADALAEIDIETEAKQV